MIRRPLALAGLLALAGCAVPAGDGNYVEPIGGALVTDNATAYADALACLGTAVRAGGATDAFAVGNLVDLTGKDDYYTGRPLTQGAALMAISALGRLGLPQVERFDTSVIELELEYANEKLIGDPDEPEAFRRILAGSVAGSRYHLVGGITELNFNIHSSAADLLVGPVSLGGRFYVMNVGLDLRLVETRTSRILHTVSYQKQIVGREIRAGFFEFVGGEPLDLGLGERSQEPVQRGVRMVVERGVIELVSRLYGLSPSDCLPEEGRPLWAEGGYLADAASPVQPTRPAATGAGRAKER